MQVSTTATVTAKAQLVQLREAAAVLEACSGHPCSGQPYINDPQAAQDVAAEWESRLAAVNTAVAASLRPPSPGGARFADGSVGPGGASPRALHQAELIEAVNSCAGNSVIFLPLGLGVRVVTDAVLSSAAAQNPDKHLLVVVDRPAQALSHAQRLRADLGLPTAVFCGGDFLYSFPQQFATNRVLVFTAGLLLRLLKTGVYRLEQASTMLLVDALTVVRNHPANTLVREYWKAAGEGARPRVVGVLASQLPAKPRPFDRLRQNLRKLCHSLQAQLLLPGGGGLAHMEAQLHHDSITLHSYAPTTGEEGLACALQQHLLALWDVLHEFGLNHFGRLVQFAAAGGATGAGAGAGGTPGTPAGLAAVGTPGAATAPGSAAMSDPQQRQWRTPPLGTPTPPRAPYSVSPLSGAASPLDGGSPATPLLGTPPTWTPQHGGNSAAAAAAEQPDPMQHDWVQVELQVVHSLWHSNALPSKGEHVREADALALMMHVQDCVRALRLLLEQGPAACLARLPDALRSLAAFLEEGLAAGLPFGGDQLPPLKARILEVAAASPLLAWARQAGADSQHGGEHGALGTQTFAADGGAPGGATGGPAAFVANGAPAGTAASPASVAAEPGARVQALLELLGDLQEHARLVGEQRLVAVVTTDAESAAVLIGAISGTEALGGVGACLLSEAAARQPNGAPTGGTVEHAPASAVVAVLSEPSGEEDGGLEAAFTLATDPDGSPAMERDISVIGWLAASEDQPQSGAQGLEPAAGAPGTATVGPASTVPPPGHEPVPAAETSASCDKAVDHSEGVSPPDGGPCGIVVHLLPACDLAQLEERISTYHALVWYSSGDVLHATSQELDSPALTACHRLSAAALGSAGAAAAGGEGAPAGQAPRRLECHVLATASQVLALGEVRRVDHSLKAAMQLVALGDGGAEEKLTMLAHKHTAGVLEPQARTILDMLCLGLCGNAPALATTAASPAKPPRSGPAGAGEPGAAAAPQLFQCSVTLPAASFPPERFFAGSISMPLDVFVGPPAPSEEQAANAAALLALAALHRLGILVRYWPSRLLLAQHLLPRGVPQPPASPFAAAGPVPSPAPPHSALQQQQQQEVMGGTTPPGAATPMPDLSPTLASTAAFMPTAASPQQGSPVLPSSGATVHPGMNFFCPLCNVAATGEKAFKAHISGYRHQRRIKQAQLLQQGEEVSDMLQGLLLDGALPGRPPRAPVSHAMQPLALGRTAVEMEEEEAGDYGSPSFGDRRIYSPEPTPFRCEACAVYCTSQRLLEAHLRGRKHQRRAADGDSPGGPLRPGSPRAQPLVTPYFCSLCGLYATSEEQLRMHMLGKRHTRMTALQRQRAGAGGTPAGLLSPMGPLPQDFTAPGPSLQQQQHQLLTAVAAAAAAAWPQGGASGEQGAGYLPSLSFTAPPSSLPATSLAAFQAGGAQPLPSPAPLLAPGSTPPALSGWAAEEPSAVLQGMLLDGAGHQRIYRCELCGVVTPSRRHYEYHLQGVKHTRRAIRAQGLDPGSVSLPGTPASAASPLGSRSASPGPRRGRHSRHSSADWSVGTPGGGPAGLGGGPEPPPESLICSVCGIMATSAINLEDHYKGRRHQKNVERQAAQEAAAAAAIAAAAAASDGQLPPLPPNISAAGGPFASSSPSFQATPSSASGGGALASAPSLAPAPSLQRSTSGITLGADGLRLSGGALLSASSLTRLPSGDLYDGFPCVRVGDVMLPSSMDLRAFLEEMQQLDDADDETDQLPPIAEHHESGSGGATELEAATGAGASGHLPEYALQRERSLGLRGSAAGPAGRVPGGAPVPPSSRGQDARYAQPPSPPLTASTTASSSGSFGRAGSRPSSGNARLSRFAQDQQQQQQQAAAAALHYGQQGLGLPGTALYGLQGAQSGYAQALALQQQYMQAAYGGLPVSYGLPSDYASAEAILVAQQQAAVQQAVQMQQMQLAAAYGVPGLAGYAGQPVQEQSPAFFAGSSYPPSNQARGPSLPPHRYHY